MKHFLIILLFCVVTGVPAEEKVCEVERLNIVERVVNRSYPSVYASWGHEIANEPMPEDIWDWSYYKKVLSRRDMFWQGSFIANVYFPRRPPENANLVFRSGSPDKIEWVLDRRSEIQSLNPNFIFLVEMYYYGIEVDSYPEDFPYWLRDEAGNIVHDPFWNQHLIDFTLPGAEDHFVKMAVSVAKCGIFDGIFLDLWSEDEGDLEPELDHLYHGNQIEALVSLVKRIREAVGNEFLILVNTRTQKIPRSAPYVNGAFIETWDAAYPRERLVELENALSWYEANLRYPQINCLEVAKKPSESWDSPANKQLARAATTLVLTHSNGYILVHNKAENDYDSRYWYPFFDASLGRPIGAKGETYEGIDGLFIREFTNGWAVYNRSGKEQIISLPRSTAVSRQQTATEHVIPDLDGEIYLKSPQGDLNADRIVNILDLVLVAGDFGVENPSHDLNGDGVVNVLDLVIVSNSIGTHK